MKVMVAIIGFLIIACGPARDPVLDGVGTACQQDKDCGPMLQCMSYREETPLLCYGTRVNGQDCPEGGLPLAWGLINQSTGLNKAWFACTVRCHSNDDCPNKLKCDTKRQACLP